MNTLSVDPIEAIDYLLEKVFRLSVRKALDPHNPHDFLVISNELQQALKGLSQEDEAKALKVALAKLDVDWKGMDAAAKAKVVGASKSALNPSSVVVPKVQKLFEANAQELGMLSKGSMVKQVGFSINPSLSKTEVRSLQAIAFSQVNFVRDEYGKRSDAFGLKAKEIVANGLQEGHGRVEIAQALQAQLTAQQFKRSDSYWELIAGSFVGRARTYTNLSTFQSAGVTTFTFQAVRDERTSNICRMMHGRSFSVSAAIDTYHAAESAKDPEAVKQIQPWVSRGVDAQGNAMLYYRDAGGAKQRVADIAQDASGKVDESGKFANAMSDKQLSKAGIMTPPLHGHCFPGGTRVQGQFTGGLKAFYSGKMRQVKTRSGNHLSVTPNHYILSSRGFVLASELREGDQLVSHRGDVDARAGDGAGALLAYEGNGPTTIAEVLGALQNMRESLRVDRSALDLNGDECAFQGDVDVVGADRVLVGWFKTVCLQSLDQLALETTTLSKVDCRGFCAIGARGFSIRCGSSSSPSGCALPLHHCAALSRPFEALRFGTAAHIHTSRYEMSTQGRRADSDFLAELFERNAGSVAFDDIVEVTDDEFCGHVYDLQTLGGWFVASGVVVSNCRSTIVPDVRNVTVQVPQSFALEPSGEQAPRAPTAPQQAAPASEGQLTLDFDKPVAVPSIVPAAPPVQIYPMGPSPQQKALEQLAALTVNGSVPMDFPQGKMGNVALDLQKDLIDAALKEATYAKKGVAALKSPAQGLLDPVKIANYINSPKALLAADVKVVKFGNELYVIDGHEAVMAAKLQGKVTIKVLSADPKAYAAEQKAKAVEAVAKPSAPAVPPKPTPALADNILHNKYGDAKGSNEGGFYEGKDGVKRYVKFYKDPAQAQGEILSHAVYKALGFEAPDASTFEKDGRQVYAASIVEGRTLGSEKLEKKDAQKFFKGFAADVLLGNWDAAGASVDNAFLTKGGNIVRIDNGGALLMRAQAGRKREADLFHIGEMETFFPGGAFSNPGYHKLANAAGYSSVNDFKDEFVSQVGAIAKMRDKYGGWDNFVSQYAPGLQGADRANVVKMLDTRAKLLEARADAIVNPPAPAKSDALPRAEQWPGRGRAAPVQGATAPKRGLTADALPEGKPIFSAGSSWKAGETSKTPAGESSAQYAARTDAGAEKLKGPGRSAIENFTGSGYGNMRAAQAAMKQGQPVYGYAETSVKHVIAAEAAIKKIPPEPGTVYRGIQGLSKDMVDKMISNDGPLRLGQNNVGVLSSTAWDPSVCTRGSFMGQPKDPPNGDSYKVFFQIHHKSGVPVQSISANGTGEREILMSGDAQFRVLGSARLEGQKRVIIIEIEEV